MNAVALPNRVAITLLLAVSGCYAAERPSAAGTNTSWLQSCETDADCSAPLACIGGFCTYACAPLGALDCEPPPLDDATGGAAGASSPTGTPSATGAPSASSSTGATSAAPPVAPTTGMNSFDDQGAIILSDSTRQAGTPRLAFIDGHFVAAWSSLPWPDRLPAGEYAGEQLNLAELSERGVELVWTQMPARVPSHRIGAIGPDGRIGALPYGGAGCAVEIFQPRLIGAYQRMQVDCDGYDAIALAPIPGTPEWVIAHGDGESVYVGRYDPAAETWIQPALSVGAGGQGQVIGVTVDGDDALVTWGNGRGTQVRAVHGLAAPSAADAPELGPELDLEGTVRLDGNFAFARVEDRLLVIGMDGGALWAASFADIDEAPEATTVAASGIADRRPGIAAAPELGLAGVCFATGPGPAGGQLGRRDGVSFALIDGEGRLVGEPRTLASNLWNIGGCDIAWSGEAFLVAWWDIDLAADPEMSLLRGQRITDGW